MNKILLILACAAALCGCKSSAGHAETREETTSVRRDADSLDGRVSAIQTARTPAEEADAIRALHQWEVKNGLTYSMQAVRVADNVAVKQPSGSGQPVSATVTIYRVRDIAKTFSFVPKDNRNLALFGE